VTRHERWPVDQIAIEIRGSIMVSSLHEELRASLTLCKLSIDGSSAVRLHFKSGRCR
jgi:hypothetical protein